MRQIHVSLLRLSLRLSLATFSLLSTSAFAEPTDNGQSSTTAEPSDKHPLSKKDSGIELYGNIDISYERYHHAGH